MLQYSGSKYAVQLGNQDWIAVFVSRGPKTRSSHYEISIH
jgi:hypothetical protein